MSQTPNKQEEGPVYCKMMCLIGIIYCYLVDQSLFREKLTTEQIALCAALTCLILITLTVKACIGDEQE